MHNLLDPAILFFVFGVFAGTIKSNLEIPPPIARFLSLYLLMALGLKGGFALAKSGLTVEVATCLALAVLLAVCIPVVGYALLRRGLSGYDAAAVAATYGSVSAVTFITATQTLERSGIAYGGHMAAAMALMESPAIIFAVVMANRLRRSLPSVASAVDTGAGSPHDASLVGILRESFTDGAQLLLLGAMAIGIVTGESGKVAMQPFTGDLFKGMLAFFLLDMGLMVARHMPPMREVPRRLLAYALLGPLIHAALALALARLAGLSAGDGALLMVLAASASYIAVPAVLRFAIAEAKPAYYFGMSLGVTFPLNILLGIPFYIGMARQWLG